MTCSLFMMIGLTQITHNYLENKLVALTYNEGKNAYLVQLGQHVDIYSKHTI